MISLIFFFCLFNISYGMSVPTVELLDGNKMPLVGFGTAVIDESKIVSVITTALANGYRHIDTAHFYKNEKYIGQALKKWFTSGGKREELFITSKLPPYAMRPSDVEEALNLSLSALGIDYLDMYLIHLPFGLQKTSNFSYFMYKNGSAAMDLSTDIIAVWKKLEEQTRAGKTKSIGLSNFNKTQVLRIWEHAQIKPTNLQVETNVYIQQDELHELSQKLGIVMTAYSPLGSGDRHGRWEHEIDLVSPFNHPVVLKIAKNHFKSPAQVLLRFNVQRNIIVIPMSTNSDRMKENMDIFDFELTEEEMNELRTLDQHGNYRKHDMLDLFGAIYLHPEYPFGDVLERLSLNLKKQ